ncbi:unnamed protein product [Candidula unifasciata]|uniref:DUF3990 domain-containing protein n=1 Tax=Candidula unifasciata TaxID=100452 RepID=A0A8S3YHM3_9EUPU|nr:unnamed protein product [Candidula unifasciata]
MALLTDSIFPYEYERTGRWYRREIERPEFMEPGLRLVRTKVKMINFYRDSDSDISDIATTQAMVHTEPNEVVYYHGTTDTHATNILERGIDLKKSRARQDFSNGNGFYVTQDIDKAVEWAKRKARGGTGAIIAFRISKDLEREEPHLSLEVHTARREQLWRKVVSYFRKGVYDSEVVSLVQNQKFITGPVSDVRTTPYDFDQTCIRDADYAKRFGRLQNILFVIFIA